MLNLLKKTIPLPIIFVTSLLAATADARLVVTPTKVIFSERDRVQEVSLVNKSDKATTYRILFQEKKMLESGVYENLTLDDEVPWSAREMIRYSPRQITLQANEKQSVRLLLRKPKNLTDGEYRSHLFFTELPPEDFGNDAESLNKKDDKVGMQLIPLFAVSIPVLVRHGDVTASASFAQWTLTQEETRSLGQDKQQPLQWVLSGELHREGNRSLSGNIDVLFTPNNSSEAYSVGKLNGVAVYTPLAKRKVSIKLQPDITLSQGTLRVVYYNRLEKTGNNGDVLAETTLDFGG